MESEHPEPAVTFKRTESNQLVVPGLLTWIVNDVFDVFVPEMMLAWFPTRHKWATPGGVVVEVRVMIKGLQPALVDMVKLGTGLVMVRNTICMVSFLKQPNLLETMRRIVTESPVLVMVYPGKPVEVADDPTKVPFTYQE